MVGAVSTRTLVAALALASLAVAAHADRAEVLVSPTPTPPLTISGWTRPAEARRVEPSGIFDYMDGGGELYLAYRFDHADVYEYAPRDATEDTILVEVYAMGGSDDAYGLLSQDWDGESVSLGPSWPTQERRALYGAGLLRVWTDDLYLRVMAYQETPASREAVLALGRVLVAGRVVPAPPALVGRIPGDVEARWRARLDRHVFLRSHLVLNAAHFLATANVLDLTLDAEAVLVPYADAQAAGQPPRVRLLVIRYADDTAARAAVVHFRTGYLPETAREPATDERLIHVEDGWTGWRLAGRSLVLVFAAPDEAGGQQLLAAASTAAQRPGL
jgi:hypothetical protein